MDIILAFAGAGFVSAVALAVLVTLIGTNVFHISYEVTAKYGFIAGLLASIAILGAVLELSGHQAAMQAAWWTLAISGVPLLTFLLFLFARRPKN